MPKEKSVPTPAGKRAAPTKNRKAPGRAGKSKNRACSPKGSAPPEESSPISSDLKLLSEGPAGPRIPIGEALRELGIDERAIAGNYVHVLKKLKAPKADTGGVQKLFVDVLKELSRQIEASQPPRAPHSDAPVVVQLVHSVARPVRA
jgi:hypothetical protein